jgi:WD40 repeat protein
LDLSFSRFLLSIWTIVRLSYAAELMFFPLKQVFRIPLNGDQCGDAESVDVGGQPNALNIAAQQPEFALITTDSAIVLLHKTTITSTTKVSYTITSSAVSPDGTEAIVGAQDGKLRIYSISGDTVTEEAILEKHRGAITSIHYSPDVSMFASADANREAVAWDRATREVLLFHNFYDFLLS